MEMGENMRIAVTNLSGERGGDLIFSGISFAVEAGSALVVTGPNGAGKSTLLRITAGLLPSSAGMVELTGGGEKWPDVASASHYLGATNAMKPALTVQENLVFWQSFLGESLCTTDEALEKVGLLDIAHLPFGYLSTGQRRRATIARLLVAHRPIWLLDEPTSGLDKVSERRFTDLMREHLDRNGLIIAATHLPLGLENMQELQMIGSNE